jgi:hypothetical protein
VISLLFRQLRWLFRYPYLPEIVGLLVATGIAVWFRNEVAIRWIGMLLQLVGVLEAAYGIRQTRKLFNRPFGRQWFAERPRKREVIQAVGSAGGLNLVMGRMRGRVDVPPDADMEQRVSRLEKNYELLFNEVGTETNALRANDAEIEEKLNNEEAQRKTGDSTVSNQLAETAIGGLRLQLSGVILLLAGIILGTASREIADRHIAFW